MEAARAWNLCRDIHLEARRNGLQWPNRDDLQKATRGLFSLHSQTVQMICHAFLANVDTARQVKKVNPKMRYPYKTKQFYPLLWPEQAVCIEPGYVTLPMGRGRSSIVLRINLPDNAGACKVCWNDGFELHFSIPVMAENPPGSNHATADLGEIHQAAVATDTGQALIISGRGIRSLKRRQNIALGEIAKKRSRCEKNSRRWKKLQRARTKVSSRTERRVRDLRHQGASKVIEFCKRNHVGSLFVGNPDGVRSKPSGRYHNQRISQWEYGKDIDYLSHKSERAGIMCFTGNERGTSSRCPGCGHRQKPTGRVWKCKSCGFTGHRDIVGAVNMHPIAFGSEIEFPHRITYLRPGPLKGAGSGMNNRSPSDRSSSPGTGPSCLSKPAGQPPGNGVSQETGQTAGVA
jgi:putative transposase